MKVDNDDVANSLNKVKTEGLEACKTAFLSLPLFLLLYLSFTLFCQQMSHQFKLKRFIFNQGGIKTSEEMCASFLYYYPRIPLEICNSGPATGINIVKDMVGANVVK